MQFKNAHLSEQELVLAADGELTGRRKAEVNAHLETCWQCRERMQTLQSAIADFVRARNRDFNEHLPPAAGAASAVAGAPGGTVGDSANVAGLCAARHADRTARRGLPCRPGGNPRDLPVDR